MDKIIPIVLFVYNRPELLERVLAQLANQTKAVGQIIVYSDAAVDNDAKDGVEKVRNILYSSKNIPVRVVCRPRNFGCAKNIVEGISEALSQYSEAIILEDDVFPSIVFYESMIRMLQHYRSEKQVFSVGGYPSLLPDALAAYPYDAIVSARFSCWGWATWADRWQRIGQDCLHAPCPYRTPSEVPVCAGDDIPNVVNLVNNRPGYYWDLPIALRCLSQDMYHVLSKTYLTNNIGTESGVHGQVNSDSSLFFRVNNTLNNVIPHKLPPVDLLDSVVEAQQQYLYAGANCRGKSISPQLKNAKQQGMDMWFMIKQMRQTFNRSWGNVIGRMKDQFGFSPPWQGQDPSIYSTIIGKGSVVPCQIEAYFLALNQYVNAGDYVLDVGFGLGYGLNILAIKAAMVSGVDVDEKVFKYCTDTIVGRNPKLKELRLYDGTKLPFDDEVFDVVTCVDVLEHVQDYHAFLDELLRVSRKGVFISTPNRRPEYTNADGSPKNYWHLREWIYEELEAILSQHGDVDWNFLDGPFEGPFRISKQAGSDTLTLSPFLIKN